MYKNYNMNQVVLSFDFTVELEKKDIAFAIHGLVESIPEEAFAEFLQEAGCPAYHPRMMLKIILCGYTQSLFSGRKIEANLVDSIRMRWLSQNQRPSYRTINRFRSDERVKLLLEACFVQFRMKLVQEGVIDEATIFIDGTKIEANANKFSFVWKKAVKKNEEKLIEKSKKIYTELLEKEIIPAIEQESEDELRAEELEEVAASLAQVVDTYTEAIEANACGAERKVLRSQRKKPKAYLKQFSDFRERRIQYHQHDGIFGERNSYSKTDHDATFMRMKDDAMKNGQLKAGYNLQIATNHQYVLGYDVFWNPTDTKTLIPFLGTLTQTFQVNPTYIVADAGYGSEANDQHILENTGQVPLITYSTYYKEQKKKYQHDRFHPANWPYDKAQGCYICPAGQRLNYSGTGKRKDPYGYERTIDFYACEDCTNCSVREQCTKAKPGRNRMIQKNRRWETYKQAVQSLLCKDQTSALYKKRKTDVEPAFGFLKASLGFTRMSLRGKKKVQNELGFALMAVNLRKYTAKTESLSCIV